MLKSTLTVRAIAFATAAFLASTACTALAQWPAPPRGSASWGPVQGDLAAHRIEFRLVSKHDQAGLKGTVQIVGVVRNVGGTDYRGRGSATLYELTMGKSPRQLGRIHFGHVRPGQELVVRHQRNWNTAWSIPPNYRLVVLLDPDAPDANHGNNTKFRNGNEMDSVFKPLFLKVVPPREPYRPIPIDPKRFKVIRRR